MLEKALPQPESGSQDLQNSPSDKKNWCWETIPALQTRSSELCFLLLTSGGTCRSGEGRSSERRLISNVVKDQLSLPPPDAKPEFHSVRACVMKIDPDQLPFFYNADAATGKKVQLYTWPLPAAGCLPSLQFLLLHPPELHDISCFGTLIHTLPCLALPPLMSDPSHTGFSPHSSLSHCVYKDSRL